MLKIAFVCGFKRSGKDTLAKYLEENYNYTHLKISQPLKDATKILFNLSNEQLEDDIKDVIDTRWNVTPREILRYLGTDVFQYKINELLPYTQKKFWINHLINDIEEKYIDNNKRIVISDLRFKHEYDAIREFGYKYNNKVDIKIIKIARIGGEQRFFNKDSHESETEHLDFHYDIIVENIQNEEKDFLDRIDFIANNKL